MVLMHCRSLNAEDTEWISERARALGFDACGVAKADHFPELDRLPQWLARGYAGEMRYLEDPRRASARASMPEARSVIVCLLNYHTEFPLSVDRVNSGDAGSDNGPRGWISRYAWGDDYHEVLWRMLDRLAANLRRRFGEEFVARSYADTGPVPERVLAKHAGLGWIGKNTLLLNQNLGSWFFLGAILTSLDLDPSLGAHGLPPADRCGTCRRCIDACPTAALVEPYVLDARRCISYLTIELRGSIPEEFRAAMGNHVFGCDICQDVCPWNRRVPFTAQSAFAPRKVAEKAGESLFEPSLVWLASLSEEEYRRTFRGSAVKRTKWRGLVRNACIALGNATFPAESEVRKRIVTLLQAHARGNDPVIAESARWALARIQQSARNGDAELLSAPACAVERQTHPDV